MPLDLDKLPPQDRAQAAMFFTMLQGMPDDALRVFILMLQEELDSRDE